MTNPALQLETYSDLIIEAFVHPIRSVAVIDDEYPTLNSFLNVELNKDKKFTVLKKPEEPREKQLKIENIERLNAITQMCHQKHKWSVSVYDGKSPKFGSQQDHHEECLNHSDLLILDYHLDGDKADIGGVRARNVLNSLSQNNHFNLVIVHTKGDENSIESVYNDILEDLLQIEKHSFNIDDDTDETIEDWLDANDLESATITVVNDTLDIKELIRVLTCKVLKTNIRNPKHPFYYAQVDIKALVDGTGLSQVEVVSWLILKELAKHEELQIGHSNLDWGYDADDNFIATGRVFITVVKKEANEDAELLYDKLCSALAKQDATPMYLLMAKMRYELDEKGLAQASDIINNRYAQAGWLFNLLDKSDNDPTQHEKAIDLHWEQLSTSSKGELVGFSKRLISSLTRATPKNRDIVKNFFRECINQKHEALGNLNAYSCSRSVSNYHLTTGTILKTDSDELWVCLSPACDLVPKQRQGDWEDRIGLNHIAFKAIKLYKDETQLATANSNANENEFVFLNIEGELHFYKFSNGNPQWETFYAQDLGVFNTEGEIKEINVNCLRIDAPSEAVKVAEGAVEEAAKDAVDEVVENVAIQIPALKVVELKMKVIAELRYEYALNFLHKFGANQTRVGLGFADKLW
jgi:hypothetical protein